MSKKNKFDNVVLALQPNQNKVGFEFVFNELNLQVVSLVSAINNYYLTHSLAIYFVLAISSFVLMFLVNFLFSIVLAVSLLKMFDSYKFYLIKKDFEENGVF